MCNKICGGQTLRAFEKKMWWKIYRPIRNQDWSWRIRINEEIVLLVKINYNKMYKSTENKIVWVCLRQAKQRTMEGIKEWR